MKGQEGERPPAPVDSKGGGSTPPNPGEDFDPLAEDYIDPLTGKEWRSRQLAKWGLGCPEGDFLPDVDISTHVKVADLKILYPGIGAKVIGEMTEQSEYRVKRILDTPYAKRRMDLTADIREPIQRRLRNNVFKSLEYLQRVLAKANLEIEKDDPDYAVLRSGDKAASETLRGTGILQDFHNIPNAGDKPLSFTDIRAMLADPALAAALKAKNEQKEAHEQAS